MKGLLILGMVLLSTNVFAVDGNEKGNGGFLYSRTSKKLLDESQTSLLVELGSVLKSRSNLIYTSSSCPKAIDLREINSAVASLTYSYEAKSIGTNPDGKEEKRYFHINNDNKVEATEIYFASFVDTYFRYSEETDIIKKQAIIQPVRTAILHESLHLFDYNELESRECSNDLIKVIESYNTDKLKKLQIKTILKNDKLIEQKLISSRCLTVWDFANEQYYIHRIYSRTPKSYIKFGERVYYCLIESFGAINMEDRSTTISDVIFGIPESIREDNKLIDTARYLNSVMKFPFEDEIPTQL